MDSLLFGAQYKEDSWSTDLVREDGIYHSNNLSHGFYFVTQTNVRRQTK